jgi:hypothetical protein
MKVNVMTEHQCSRTIKATKAKALFTLQKKIESDE